jgi:hypothetical protein
MEGKARTKERRVVRDHEYNRLEEELWAQAYERIWPALRRIAPRTRRSGRVEPAVPKAKGA